MLNQFGRPAFGTDNADKAVRHGIGNADAEALDFIPGLQGKLRMKEDIRLPELDVALLVIDITQERNPATGVARIDGVLDLG